MLRPVSVAEQGAGAAVSLRTFVEALAEGRSMAANTPLLAGRGGSPVPTPAGRAAVRAAVALAVLAACVCAALLAFPSSPAAPAELYLPLAVPAQRSGICRSAQRLRFPDCMAAHCSGVPRSPTEQGAF